MSPNDALSLVQVQFAVEYAQEQPEEWVILVCPNGKIAHDRIRYLAGALPPGSVSSGRTALLPNGSRISGMHAHQKVPEGVSFFVMFLDWHNASAGDYAQMSKWREGASCVLTMDMAHA